MRNLAHRLGRLGHRLSLLAILPLVLLAACHEQAGKARQAAARPLPVVTATTTAWPQVVRVPATVSAVDTAVLASRTGGWVSAVTVDAGTRVARGALLVAVDVPAARGQLAEAQSRLAAAKAALTQAAADESRYAALSKTHAASAQQYDIARRAAITARAELQAAQSGLLAAEANFGYAEIRAPFAGVVAEKKVWLGDFVAPGAPLLTLASDTPEIRAHVSADIFPALKLGELAEVTIDGQTQPATVTRLVDTADPATRTHLIELHLAPGVSAPFGAYADLRLTLGTAPQLTVPQSALIRRADLPGVFVVDAGGHARFRLVRFGAVRDGRVAITAGLSGGETVVLAPPADLVDGTPVHPEAAPAAASGAGSSRG